MQNSSAQAELVRIACPGCGAWWFSHEAAVDSAVMEIKCRGCKRLVPFRVVDGRPQELTAR